MSTIEQPLHPAVQAYLLRVKELAGSYTPSLFWERQLAGLRESPAYANLEQLGAEAVEAMMASMRYGFTKLDAGTSEVSEDPDLRRAIELANILDVTAGRLTAETLEVDKETWEHARALCFLQRRRLLADYISFLTPLRVGSSMSVARHYFYARLVLALAREHCGEAGLDILEIGAGAGNLAAFLHTMGLVRSYCIVDLPEILLHSGYTISKYVPEALLAFEPPPATPQVGSYWFVVPQEIDRIHNGEFSLCLNFNSFMEMDTGTLNRYFQLMYRAARKNGLFVNVNRRQRSLPQRDGTVFDNNPLLYPYRSTDRVLVWEEESFQQATRSGFGELPSLAVLRAALVNPV